MIKTFRKIISALSLLILFNTLASAEYILVKKQGTDLIPISYSTLTDLERAEVDKIYSDILMTYQWPMITMHYPNWDKESQREVLNSLKDSENKFALFTVARQKLAEQYKDNYDLIYTPETIFEMATILQYAKNTISRTKSYPSQDLRNASYVDEFRKDNFVGKLAETLAKASELKLDKEKQYAYFLNQTYGIHNERQEIKEVYFDTCKYLVETYKNDLDKEDKINQIVQELLANYTALSSSFLTALKQFNSRILTKAAGGDQYPKTLLSNIYLSLLKSAALLQFNAEKNSHFNLFRGTQGLKLNAEQQLLDAPTREFTKEYKNVESSSALFNKLIAYRYNIKEPTALKNSSNNKVEDHFTPTSLSFGNTILSGSFYELSEGRETGARPIDFISKFNKGYSLSIPIATYLETPFVNQDFFVSPFSTVMSLFGHGEFFHSRSKVSLYSPGYAWSGTIVGIVGIEGESYSPHSDIILQDLASGLGYLVRPGIEWPRLSGLITQDIGNYAELISIVNNQDINNLHKSFGLFEFEATGLREHLDKYQKVTDELSKSNLDTLLKTGVDRDVYKRRLEKCREIISNLSQNSSNVGERKKQKQINRILEGASLGLDTVGKSSEKINGDPFEEFMRKITDNLMNILEPTSLDAKNNPLELYKNYKTQLSNEIAAQLRSKPQPSPVKDESDNRVYDENNVFGDIIKNPQKNLKTSAYANTTDVMAFDDLRKRTAEHFLVIPKGPYISLPHFAAHAKDNEMVDMLRTIVEVAEAKGLDKTGYRVISNHAVIPGASTNNNANQEVPHFHMHVAGGECLGKPVAAKSEEDSILYSENMPFGLGLPAKDLVKVAYQNQIAADKVDYKGQKVTLLAYNLPDKKFGVPNYVGILILDEKQNPLFHSFHEFAKFAEAPLIKALFSFTTNLSKMIGVYDSGYRIISNIGPDAWQYPDVFQLFVAGGTTLGPTVTNVYGNRMGVFDSRVYDYSDLQGYGHDHCRPLFEFNKESVDTASLADLQRQNRTLYTNNLNSLESLKNKMIGIPTYLRKLKSEAKTPLQQNIASQKERLYQEAIQILDEIEPVMTDLKKYKLDYNFHPSLQENKKFYKIGTEISDKLSVLRYKVEGIGTTGSQSGYNIHPISDLLGTILKSDNVTIDSWLFLDLDDVVTKGIDSLDLIEQGLPQRIKDLQAQGKKILALTNRFYWDDMDNDPTNKSHKDTFKLLQQLGISFTNPGNLKPFLLNTKFAIDDKHQSKFMDGIIFCADDPRGKGVCLDKYLSELTKSGVSEFPDAIEFVDDRLDNVKSVVEKMERLSIPVDGYWYKP